MKTQKTHKSPPTNKRKNIFLFVCTLALIVILAGKTVNPTLEHWHNQTEQIRQKNEAIKEYGYILQQEDALKDSFARLSHQIQTEIPVEREESQFLIEIGNVATDTNVHISTMNPRPFKDFDSFKELSVEIEMEANLGNLTRFLYEMRKSSVVLVVNSLNLEPKSERSALLKGHLIISTMFLKNK